MPEQLQDVSKESLPWWVKFCRWLKARLLSIWGTIIGGILVSTLANLFTTTTDTPLSKLYLVHLVLTFPIPVSTSFGVLVLLTLLSLPGSRERNAATLTRDQDRVKRLQRCLGNWDPDGRCEWHKVKHCEYDQQRRLMKLHLCELKLAQVPSEVWQFLSLQELGLSGNQLSTLPVQIGRLSSLQRLYLDGNWLSTLPVQIGQLSSLQKLDLSDNRLSVLPKAMRKLSSSLGEEELDLNNNPFPPETLVQEILPRSFLAKP